MKLHKEAPLSCLVNTLLLPFRLLFGLFRCLFAVLLIGGIVYLVAWVVMAVLGG